MNRLSLSDKIQALNNAIEYYGFDPKYSIEVADKRIGQKFALAIKTDSSLNVKTNFMTYDEFNCWLFGYKAAKENQF